MIKPDEDKKSEVVKGLSDLFNRTGMDNATETPDYVLAVVAYSAVLAFAEASEERDKHSMKVPTTTDWTGLPMPKKIPPMPPVVPPLESFREDEDYPEEE